MLHTDLVLLPAGSCVDPSPYRYGVTMGRCWQESLQAIHMHGINSSDSGCAFRWEQMADCKREPVPQISVEAVENPAMKTHGTKVLMLGFRNHWVQRQILQDNWNTRTWLGEQLLLHLKILPVLCHANQRASCDGFQMTNKHWPLVEGGLCHCECCWWHPFQVPMELWASLLH